MESSEEQSPVIESVSFASGSFSIRERDAESALPPNVDGKKPLGKSFYGRGLDIVWDRDGDKEESKRVRFVNDALEDIFEEDEDDEMEEYDGRQSDQFEENYSTRKHSPGNGIKDKYVFFLEILSDRHFRLAAAIIYLTFAAYNAVRFSFERRLADEVVSAAVLPANASKDEFTCYIQPDKSCIPGPLTVGQASLLANTVVVSEGIDSTDWVGNGVKPGTQPFSAHSGSGIFIADSSVLDFNTNSDLQPVWDDIVAVLWTGFENDFTFDTFREYTLTMKFQKMDGDWPHNITDIPLILYQDAFSCVRGGEGYCDSIGNWRITWKIKHFDLPDVKVERNELSINLGYDEEIDYIFFKRFATRFVLAAENGDSIVSDCIRNNRCITILSARGRLSRSTETAWVLLCYFIIYLAFFIWWIISLMKRKGAPNMWPSEDVWLISAGLGFLFANNILLIVLELSMGYSDTFVFSQHTFAAAECLSRLGIAALTYSMICFIDAPRRYVATRLEFYGYKTLLFILFFICDVIIIVDYYPKASGRDESGTNEELGGVGFKTNTSLWNDRDRTVHAFALTTWFILTAIGVGYYIWKFIFGFRLLDKLPYGMTRHTQLSFRFFSYISFIFIITEYIILLISFISELTTDDYDYLWSASVSHRQYRDRTIAKSTFEMFFIMVLQVFFLPLPPNHSYGQKKDFYLSEDEIMEYTESRRSKSKYPMFLDKAKLLCICSKEVYLPIDDDELSEIISSKKNQAKNMPEEKNQSIERSLETTDSLKTSDDDDSGINASTNIPGLRLAGAMVNGEKLNATIVSNSTWAQGCRVVARIREPGGIDIHDTRVLILRHELTDDLIVAFRGTATTKQIKTDLMISRVSVSLDTFLALPHWKDEATKKIKQTTVLLSQSILGDLNDGKVAKVRLMDLLPKDNESLPPYLKDARKDQQRITGRCKIHFGFWSSYNRVREEVHKKVREELLARPGRLIITGHSLGGAQASLCAYDMCRWVLPTVKRQFLLEVKGGRAHVDKIGVTSYTFGCPKVGCSRFAAAYNDVVPDTQRIVCDGDVITTGPSFMGYHHVKRENIFDFTGTVRVEPGLMEKSFSLKSRNKAKSHFVRNYLKVIRKSFDPMISEEELLDIMRKAYRLKTK